VQSRGHTRVSNKDELFQRLHGGRHLQHVAVGVRTGRRQPSGVSARFSCSFSMPCDMTS
jgi:hypothetical protein